MTRSADVAVLGLGAMGRILATNAATADLDVVVWNRSGGVADQLADRHSRICSVTSAVGAAAAARVVLAMVTDDEASRALWLGEHAAAGALDDGTVAVEVSTLSPAWTTTLASQIAATGASFLAAPVLGSTPQAGDAALVQLVGGNASVLERARSVLATSASTILHVGAPADAAHRKLVVNGWLAGQVALAAELVGHLERAGSTREAAVGLLRGLPLTSPAIAGLLDRMATDDTDPRFPVRLVAKDARYLARAAGVDLLDSLATAWASAVDLAGDRDLVAYLHAATEHPGSR